MRDVDLGTKYSPVERMSGLILVVSPDAAGGDLICRELLRAGHAVSIAADDAATVRRLRGHAFDVVVLDGRTPPENLQRVHTALDEWHDGIDRPALLAVLGTDGKDPCTHIGVSDMAFHVSTVGIAELATEVDRQLAHRRGISASRNSPTGQERPTVHSVQTGQPRPANPGLTASERTLAEALESIDDGFVLWNAHDRLVVCNAAYRKLFGHDGDQVVPGARFESLMRRQLASGRLRVAPKQQSDWLVQRFMYHRNPNGAIEDEFADGTWIRVTERRTRAGYTVGICSEISQVKRREIALKTFAEGNRRLAAAVDATSSAILITDPARPGNPTVFANPAFTAMTGWPIEEALGRDRSFLKGPDTDLDEVARFERDMEAGKATSAVLRLKVRGGRSFWADVSASPIRDSDGRVTNWVIIQTDITAWGKLFQPAGKLLVPERTDRPTPQHAHEIDSLLAGLRGSF